MPQGMLVRRDEFYLVFADHPPKKKVPALTEFETPPYSRVADMTGYMPTKASSQNGYVFLHGTTVPFDDADVGVTRQKGAALGTAIVRLDETSAP